MEATIVTLLIVGAVLLFLEAILPGAILGILGVGCLVAGVALSYFKFDPQTGTWEFDGQTGTWVLLAVSASLVVGVIAWFKYFPHSRMGQMFVSRGTVGELGLETSSFLHQTGVAHTNLRPSGTAIINGKRVDVVAEGAFVASGAPIKVVATEGLRVVVRAVT